MEFTETGCGFHVNHGSRIHSLFRNRKGLSMDPPVPDGTKNKTNKRKGNNSNPIYGQRGCTQTNEDPNIPPADSTYRAPVPLHTRIGGPESYPSSWNQGQEQPSGSPHEALTNEFDWAMEDGNLHWLETIQWD